tara:strand:+ start:100370 stop:100507 length:138 start_codon:yes stop_codon:yes gene_type:complete
MDELKCEICGKDCEELTAKGPYNGNIDTRDMCDVCFVKVFDEQPK